MIRKILTLILIGHLFGSTTVLAQSSVTPMVMKNGRAQQVTDSDTIVIPKLQTPSLSLTPGSAPTSPQNGDVWTTSSGINVRINGVNRTIHDDGTDTFIRKDYPSLNLFPYSASNLNRWRVTATNNGAANGNLVIQNSTDNFQSNFFNALTATPSGVGINNNTPTATFDVNGVIKSNNKIEGVYFQTMNNIFPGVTGSTWSSEYHPNWNVVRTTKPYNPTEWQIYSAAANGIASVVSGTNQVVRTSGTAFDASWVGQPYFYWEGSGYTVASVTDADHLTVTTTSGGPVTWGSNGSGTYYFVVTSSDGVCNVSGTALSWVSGDGYIPNWSGIKMTVNGTPVTFTYVDNKHLTLTSGSLGTVTNAQCRQTVPINHELSNIRLQGLAGSSEENFVITYTPSGTYIQNTYAGEGKYRPIWMGTGENPIGTFNPLISMYPNATIGGAGLLNLGGDKGNQSVTISQNSNNRNFLSLGGNTPGNRAVISSRGSDTNVGMQFDVKGRDTFAFSSGSFGKPELNIYGSGGDCYTAINSTSSANEIIGLGPVTCNLKLVSGTSGVVYTEQKFQAPVVRLPHGTVPSSLVNGDIYTTSNGVYARVNGLNTKLSSESVTPQDFGAVGNNSTDDYAAFAAAISSAASQNKKLVIPRGSYVIGQKLSITSPIDVEMDHSANIRFTNPSSCGIDIDLRSAAANYGLNTVTLGGLYAPSTTSSFEYPGYPSSWSLAGRSTCDAVALRGGSRVDIYVKYILGFNAAVRISATNDANGARAPQNINVEVNTSDITTYGLYVDGGPSTAYTMAAVDVRFNTVFAKYPIYFDSVNKSFGQINVDVTGQAFTNESGGSCIYSNGSNINTTTVNIRWCYAGYSSFDSPTGTPSTLTLPYIAGSGSSLGSTTDGNSTQGYFTGFSNKITVGAAIDLAGMPGGSAPSSGNVVRVRDAGVNNDIKIGFYENASSSPKSLTNTQGEANYAGGVGSADQSRKVYVSITVPTLSAGQGTTLYSYNSLLSAATRKSIRFVPVDGSVIASKLDITPTDNSANVNREISVEIFNRTGSTVTGNTYYGWLIID